LIDEMGETIMHGRTRVKYVEADLDSKVRLMDEMEKQSCMDVPEPNVVVGAATVDEQQPRSRPSSSPSFQKL